MAAAGEGITLSGRPLRDPDGWFRAEAHKAQRCWGTEQRNILRWFDVGRRLCGDPAFPDYGVRAFPDK
jgi:hypothetical protein